MCQVHFIKHLTSFSSSVRTFTEEQLINKMYPNKGQEDSDNTGMFRLASVEMMLPIFLLVSCRFCQQLKQKEITPKLSASITLPASHSYSHQSSDQTTDLGILQTYTSPPFQLSKVLLPHQLNEFFTNWRSQCVLSVHSNGKGQSCSMLVVCGAFLNIWRNNCILKRQILCLSRSWMYSVAEQTISSTITKRVRMKHVVRESLWNQAQ